MNNPSIEYWGLGKDWDAACLRLSFQAKRGRIWQKRLWLGRRHSPPAAGTRRASAAPPNSHFILPQALLEGGFGEADA